MSGPVPNPNFSLEDAKIDGVKNSDGLDLTYIGEIFNSPSNLWVDDEKRYHVIGNSNEGLVNKNPTTFTINVYEWGPAFIKYRDHYEAAEDVKEGFKFHLVVNIPQGKCVILTQEQGQDELQKRNMLKDPPPPS